MSSEFDIPKEKVIQIMDTFTRIDEELAVIILQNNRIIQLLETIAAVSGRVEKPVVVTEKRRANRYKVYVVDLSVARNDEPLGLKDDGIVGWSMTIMRADAPFKYKINSKGHDALDASVGNLHEDWEIEEIYITNSAATAGSYGVIYVEWGEE